MSTMADLHQPPDDEARLSAAANLEISVQQVTLRAGVTVPAARAKDLLSLGQGCVLLLTGLACLGIAGVVSVMSRDATAPASLIIILVACIASLVAVSAGVEFIRRGRKGLPERSAYSVARGRPHLRRIWLIGLEKPELARTSDTGRKRRPTSYTMRKARRRRRYRSS
jgi:hypothetical protein